MLARHYIAGARGDSRELLARCDLLSALILIALLIAFLLGALL